MPRISVIMPLYNTEPNILRSAIESILSQSFSDFEFIIVCDKPTDGSNLIANEYAQADKRIVLLENPENAGVAESLNRGFAIAKGDFIARMDADDISIADRLETQLNYLENNKQIDVLFTLVQPIDEDGNYILKKSQHMHDDQITSSLFFGCLVCHPTVMIRRASLKNMDPVYTSERKAEDYDLWTRLLQRGCSFSQIDLVLHLYRIHSNQVTKKADKKLCEDSLIILYNLLLNDGLNLSMQEVKAYSELMSSVAKMDALNHRIGKVVLNKIINEGTIPVNGRYLRQRAMKMDLRRLLGK